MGSKLKTQVNANPGPGQYESKDTAITTSVKQVAISHAERTELWAIEERIGADMPGPGNYAE